MLAVSAMAALAAMAFIGAGTASAQVKHLVVLCKVNPEKLCPEGQLYKTGTIIKANLEALEGVVHTVLLGSVNELCETSSVEGKITHTSPVEGQITSVLFGACKPCTTVTVTGFPLGAKVIHDEEAGKHLWLLIITGGIWVKFTGCPLGITCIFETKEVHLDAENKATTPLVLTLENELKRIEDSELFCGNIVKWDANYLISAPTPSYLALDEKEEA